MRKGIVLAGGSGSRLWPLTASVSKQLQPIYDKPMVYYPISILMLGQIQEILIITTEDQQCFYKSLLGDGSQFGLEIEFAVQDSPRGIAEAFIIADEFIGDSPVALILGDNFFFGQGLGELLSSAGSEEQKATIFAHPVTDPERYGIIEVDDLGAPIRVEEKPTSPRSNLAVTGLYLFSSQVVDVAKQSKPSARGELEITDVIDFFLRRGELKLEVLGRGYTWLDSGTHDSLLSAGNFVQTIESRQGFKIACLEEIGYRNGWLSADSVRETAMRYKNTGYGQYLLRQLGTE